MTAPALSAAVVGNRFFPEADLGFGMITRAAQLILMENINDEIDHQADRWRSADLSFQQVVGGGPGETAIEHVAPANFHAGPHRSLIKSNADGFPAVAVTAYYANPVGFDSDDTDDLQVRMFVEIYVKAGPVTDATLIDFETVLHRRAERTAVAVDNVLRSQDHKNLLGAAMPGISQPPRGGLTNQSEVSRKGSDPLFIWQGAKLEYTVQRKSALP